MACCVVHVPPAGRADPHCRAGHREQRPCHPAGLGLAGREGGGRRSRRRWPGSRPGAGAPLWRSRTCRRRRKRRRRARHRLEVTCLLCEFAGPCRFGGLGRAQVGAGERLDEAHLLTAEVLYCPTIRRRRGRTGHAVNETVCFVLVPFVRQVAVSRLQVPPEKSSTTGAGCVSGRTRSCRCRLRRSSRATGRRRRRMLAMRRYRR